MEEKNTIFKIEWKEKPYTISFMKFEDTNTYSFIVGDDNTEQYIFMGETTIPKDILDTEEEEPKMIAIFMEYCLKNKIFEKKQEDKGSC